jgi:hypothetical protein
VVSDDPGLHNVGGAGEAANVGISPRDQLFGAAAGGCCMEQEMLPPGAAAQTSVAWVI